VVLITGPSAAACMCGASAQTVHVLGMTILNCTFSRAKVPRTHRIFALGVTTAWQIVTLPKQSTDLITSRC
jgi:hypothetical protein